jgi:hypothetical protein
MKHRIKFLFVSIGFLTIFVNSVYPIDTNKLVGAWLFDGNKDTITDSSGNGLDGEVMQGEPKQVGGKYGSAMEFGGADMITVSYDQAFDITEFTLAAWINVDGQSGKWQIIASKENRNPTGRNYGLFCNINTGVIHYSFTNNAAWQSFDAKTVVTDGTWHHVAATYDGSDFKLYLDGVVDAQTSPGVEPDTSENVFYIGGCDIGDYWMTGIIDELALFSEALSEGDVNSLMNGLDKVVIAVDPVEKLTVTWGNAKSR